MKYRIKALTMPGQRINQVRTNSGEPVRVGRNYLNGMHIVAILQVLEIK